nr:hypothetical protein [Tanacetum cinerariifolium]
RLILLIPFNCLILIESFDYRLNPLYPIKEYLSSGALYITDYCCSDGSLGDKIICDLDKTPDLSQRSPQNYPKCGHPVDGQYCQGCSLLRKKFKEDLFTYCIENRILQDSSKPSNDNTNVVNALREPFIVNQDPEPFNNQTVDELPQTLPSFDPTCYSEDGNLFTYDPKSNLSHDSPNVFDSPLQPPLYLCEFYRNDSHEFIKSSVKNLIPNPSESEGENKCDVPACEVFTTFLKILFDADYDFYSSDDQTFSDEDFLKDILILEELLRNDSLSLSENKSFHFDIPSFSRPPAKPPDGNTRILNIKMMGVISDQKAFMHKLMITLASHQEKSPDLLSYWVLKAFQPFATCPMMIHG